jgi:hypothetical protein
MDILGMDKVFEKAFVECSALLHDEFVVQTTVGGELVIYHLQGGSADIVL